MELSPKAISQLGKARVLIACLFAESSEVRVGKRLRAEMDDLQETLAVENAHVYSDDMVARLLRRTGVCARQFIALRQKK